MTRSRYRFCEMKGGYFTQSDIYPGKSNHEATRSYSPYGRSPITYGIVSQRNLFRGPYEGLPNFLLRKSSLATKSPLKEGGVREDTELGKSLQEKRVDQLAIGRDLLKAWEEMDRAALALSKENSAQSGEEVKRPRGRPKKEMKDSLKVTLKLPRKYLEFLQAVEIGESKNSPKKKKRKNEGPGGRIRKIVDNYLLMKRREEEQLKNVRRLVGEITSSLQDFMLRFKRAEHFENLEELLGKIEDSLKQLQIVKGILAWDMDDLKGMLSADEWKNLELAMTVLSNRRERGLSQ